MSVEEIAVITNTGRETAKSRLRYALTKLRQGLKDFLE
jgi:DNA-directed RNA polymerase specialized sigma24 family protein